MFDSRFDFKVENHGSIDLLRAMNEEAEQWAVENLQHPETQRWGNAYVVEPRYLGPIIEGINDDGLTVGI